MQCPCRRDKGHELSVALTISQAKNIIQAYSLCKENALNPGDVARMAVEIASEKLAEDILMLDISQLTGFADYFVIMSAQSRRQLEGLRDDLVKTLKDSGVPLHHREGTADSGWILLDYSDVIIHLFGAEERSFYGLDQLWAGAPQIVRIL